MPRKPPKRDYEVGYGRPPEKTRFKPGESGNPKGRPKANLSLATTLRRSLERSIQIKVGGQAVTMTTLDLLILQQIEKAKKGDDRAFSRITQLMIQHGLFQNEVLKHQNTAESENAAAYVRAKIEEMASRLAANSSPPVEN